MRIATTTEQAFEFYCIDSTNEESILAIIVGHGKTEVERLRDAEHEATKRDIGRGHGPVQVRGARGDALRLEIAIRESLARGVYCSGDQSAEDALHGLLDQNHFTVHPDAWAQIMSEISPRLRAANHITEWDPSRQRRRTVSRQFFLTAD